MLPVYITDCLSGSEHFFFRMPKPFHLHHHENLHVRAVAGRFQLVYPGQTEHLMWYYIRSELTNAYRLLFSATQQTIINNKLLLIPTRLL